MKNLIKQLQQNKGMSLMEVLISVAISMIVMVVAATFISNGSIFFKKQSKTIDLQNELMEVSNRINDALLQSTDELKINIGNEVNGANIYTGTYDEDSNKFTSGKGSARFIEWNSQDKTVYVMDYKTDTDKAINHNKYIAQVREYVALLRAIYPDYTIIGYILWTHDFSLEKI